MIPAVHNVRRAKRKCEYELQLVLDLFVTCDAKSPVQVNVYLSDTVVEVLENKGFFISRYKSNSQSDVRHDCTTIAW